MKLLRFLTFPFAILYDLITLIRNTLFDKEILKSTSFQIPIIAVGNLNVGGTGKTPQIEYLIRLLKDHYQLAVLSRGYKRKTKGFLVLNASHNANDVGDEPLQFYRKFSPVKVAVDADRVHGVQQLLLEQPVPEVILLDDAYQHRKIKAGYYVLLTKYKDLYIDDFVLPAGNLRERRKGAQRANVVIVTKCPPDLNQSAQELIRKRLKLLPSQHLFFSTIAYGTAIQGAASIPVKELVNYTVVLVTGIANPTPLLEFLSSLGVPYDHMKFPDHYQFTKQDAQKMEERLYNIPHQNKLILTTEKDYTRLEGMVKTVCYLPIETQFLNQEGKHFNTTILNWIKNKPTS